MRNRSGCIRRVSLLDNKCIMWKNCHITVSFGVREEKPQSSPLELKAETEKRVAETCKTCMIKP